MKKKNAIVLLAALLLCAGLCGIAAASHLEEGTRLDFGPVEVTGDHVLLAAVYNAGGRMLAVREAEEEGGCAAAVIPTEAYEKMARARLFVLRGLTLEPVGGTVTLGQTDALSYGFYEATRKVMEDEALEGQDGCCLQLARSEAEGCQLVFAPGKAGLTGGYTISWTDFAHEDGHTLRTEVFEERYIPCESNEYSGVYPDALVPVERGHTFSFTGTENHPYYIKVWADADAPAGEYTARMTVTDPAGNSVVIPVTARVWDFSLPDAPACTTAFGLQRQYIAEMHGAEPWSEEDQPLYNAYYEFLLDHNISAYDLPYDIMDERAEAYMSDPRVTSFCLPYLESWQYGEEADELTKAYYDRVLSNPEWAEKAYYYVVDEPYTAEAYEIYLETVERLEKLCPGYHMVMPTGSAEFEEDGEIYNAVLMHAQGADIFCPLSPLLEDEMLREDVEIYLPDGRLWWYVCCGPGEDYCNLFINMEGIRARLLLWQQKAYNVKGLLYWSTSFWVEGNPWDNGWTYRGSEEPDWSFEEFGDGSLLYPGSEVGVDGPVASLRLEILSDGIDDFDLLTLAEEYFGRDYVESKISQVTTSLTDYTYDDELLMLVRGGIGDDLEAYYRDGTVPG